MQSVNIERLKKRLFWNLASLIFECYVSFSLQRAHRVSVDGTIFLKVLVSKFDSFLNAFMSCVLTEWCLLCLCSVSPYSH